MRAHAQRAATITTAFVLVGAAALPRITPDP